METVEDAERQRDVAQDGPERRPIELLQTILNKTQYNVDSDIKTHCKLPNQSFATEQMRVSSLGIPHS